MAKSTQSVWTNRLHEATESILATETCTECGANFTDMTKLDDGYITCACGNHLIVGTPSQLRGYVKKVYKANEKSIRGQILPIRAEINALRAKRAFLRKEISTSRAYRKGQTEVAPLSWTLPVTQSKTLETDETVTVEESQTSSAVPDETVVVEETPIADVPEPKKGKKGKK
jgi:DNA-directed RNA polymerase subunit RPC12/RpoP